MISGFVIIEDLKGIAVPMKMCSAGGSYGLHLAGLTHGRTADMALAVGR